MKYTSKSAIAAIELNWINWTETQKLIIRQNYSQYWADHSFVMLIEVNWKLNST